MAPRTLWILILGLLTVLAPLQLAPAIAQPVDGLSAEVRCNHEPAPRWGCLRGVNGLPGAAQEVAVGPTTSEGAQFVYAVGPDREDGATVAAFDADDVSLAWSVDQPDAWPAGVTGVGAWTLEVGPRGERVFAAVETEPDRHVLTAAYDAATGDRLWETLYRSPAGSAWPTDLAVGPEGATLYVAVDAGTEDRERDVAVLAYEAATGEERWRQLSDANGRRDRPNALAAGPAGERVAVTGSASGYDVNEHRDPRPNTRLGTFVYDAATGEEIGRHVPNPSSGIGVEAGQDIVFGPDGEGIFVAGHYLVQTDQTHGHGLFYKHRMQLTAVGLDAVDASVRWQHMLGIDRPIQQADPIGALADQPDRGLAVQAYATEEGPRVLASGIVDTPFVGREWSFAQIEAVSGEIEQDQPIPQTDDRILPTDVEIAPDGSRMYGLGELDDRPAIRAVDLRAGSVLWTSEQPEERERGLSLGPNEDVAAVGIHRDAFKPGEELTVAAFDAGGPAGGAGSGVDRPAWPAEALPDSS